MNKIRLWSQEEKIFYVTLCQELSGYYIVAVASDENKLRNFLSEKYGYLWCSVYYEPPNREQRIGHTLYV